MSEQAPCVSGGKYNAFVKVKKKIKFYAVMYKLSQNLEVSFKGVTRFRGLRVVATRGPYVSFC